MQSATMTDELWQHLQALREGTVTSIDTGAARLNRQCVAVYEPIALAKGRSATEPFVLAQVGQSLDGRIATPTGDAQDVSGCDGIAHLHRCRALADAVIIGVGTVVADDPSLTVRAVSGDNPVRVVVDCNGRMPESAKMLHDGASPVLLIQADDAPANQRYDTIRLPRQQQGGLAPRDILNALFNRGLTRILVEGGATTISRFADAGLIDRLHVCIAPIIIGSGPAGIRFAPIDRLAQARRPVMRVYNIGTDILFDCDFRNDASLTADSTNGENVLMADTA